MSILKGAYQPKGWCSSLSENKKSEIKFLYDEQTITGEEIAS